MRQILPGAVNAINAKNEREQENVDRNQPRGRGVQFQIGAVLQPSNTPSLRVAEFEDEDENEAPHEHRRGTLGVLSGRIDVVDFPMAKSPGL
jgi:hypothetical protein